VTLRDLLGDTMTEIERRGQEPGHRSTARPATARRRTPRTRTGCTTSHAAITRSINAWGEVTSRNLCGHDTRSPFCGHTHAHTRLTPLFPGLPGWAGTRKVKPIWILLKQQTVSGSGISWAICKSAPRSRQITTPAPHHSSFLQACCPSCRPTNSVKALKAILWV